MSEPRNVLDNYDNHTVYFVLAAFKYTDHAEQQELYLDKDKNMGDSIGNGVIIVNDIRPSPLQIIDYTYNYIWNSLSTSTTLSTGTITFSDRNPGSFLNFLKDKVVSRFNTSLENITFSLRIFWTIQTTDFGESTTVEKSEHLYFSMSDISHQTSISHNFYTATVIPLHNCKCQLPNYSDIYNMTITHKDGNLHDEIPSANPSGGSIKPRGEEDGEKNEPRNTRLLKSKPMTTLKDLKEALEVELKQRCYIHKSQLQEWQSIIRDDFVDKLERNPTQTKEIPIDYHVEFGDGYGEYKVDNRNLPFEQPEQDQESPGIRALPVKTGETITSVIDKIMNLSKQTGIDAKNGDSYKIAMSWRRLESNIIKYNINLRKYTIPVNRATGTNTGPGRGAIQPLTFFFRSTKNGDVQAFTGRVSRNDILQITENSPTEADGKVAYGPERESITAQRDPLELDFYKSGFSGHRGFISEEKVLSVEYPNELASKMKSKYPPQSAQDANMRITIRGNPKLYSDLLRKPTDVAKQNIGKPTYYKFPEYYPIYCKFLIAYAPTNTDEENPNFSESEDVEGPFYHKDYVHIYKIENSISYGKFTQTLELIRTDDLV